MISQLRRIGLLEAASDESNEIVVRTAARIAALAQTATGELTSLRQQVEATIEAIEPPRRDSVPRTAGAAMRPVSPEARQALQEARHAVDTLLQQVDRGAPSRRRPLRVRIRTVISAAAAILLTAAGLGVATGWLSGAGSRRPGDDAGASAVATSGTVPGTGGGSAMSPDDLRAEADAWLRAYFETGAAPASTSGPAIRDERLPGERLTSPAGRRVIAPARVDIFGDAAVLSTSVTEVAAAPADRQFVSLVAQLWTRTAGQWHLDDVRIVSAAGAEHAFRR
jgi:hypothetical protein